MEKLKISQDNGFAFTIIPEYFIDRYMEGANDAQLKVYLYLLRCVQGNKTTSVSDMADLFNHTEKDILRALSYWQKQNLLQLEFDASNNLSSVCFTPISGEKGALTGKSSSDTVLGITSVQKTDNATTNQDTNRSSIIPIASATGMNRTEDAAKNFVPASNTPSLPEKVSYSLDEIDTFRENEEVEELLFIAEQYTRKTLSASSIQTLLFIYDKLGFSVNLMDYLIQYCVDRGKKDFRYMEKVALSWHENNVKTPEDAKKYSYKYDKNVYTIMKALGKSSEPTPSEVTYINRWVKEYGFSLTVIQEACDRTVSATDSHRFSYADRILSNWYKSHVQGLEDIKKADAAYRKTNNIAQPKTSGANNQFSQFPQRDYDMDELEKQLLSN